MPQSAAGHSPHDITAQESGVLLLNLGTPDSSHHSHVRKYLAEFLMDPLVVDIPLLARLALVYGIILPFRPRKSAEAYQKVWTERGSPLLFHLVDLGEKVAALLKGRHKVQIAMRYGKPSIESALQSLKASGVKEIRILPLYPQYSLAATQSSIDKTHDVARRLGLEADIRVLPPFYDAQPFIEAFSEVARKAVEGFQQDYFLFSFHGLPERQIKRVERAPQGHCLLSEDCCERITAVNRDCYRAQCFATAHAIAAKLGLSKADFGSRYGVSFQSRLGRTPWIKPYTDLVFQELIKKGVKRVAVVCPSFVADCLETLEEIEIRGLKSFLSLGGEALKLVPSLNSTDLWAKAVAQMVSS